MEPHSAGYDHSINQQQLCVLQSARSDEETEREKKQQQQPVEFFIFCGVDGYYDINRSVRSRECF